jgi:hypothetical protein
MKVFKKYSLFFFILPVLASCTKVIDLDLGNDTGRLVIEGNITNVAGPQVIKLSQNVSMSSTNTYPAVSGATVMVSDQAGKQYPFTEGPSGTYTANSLAGVPGATYTMTVLTNAKTYGASSVMPATVTLDSLTSKNSVISTSKHKKVLTVHYQDPAGVANQYRFVIWLNKVLVKTVYAYNDDFNDGRYVSLDLRVRDDDDSDYGVYAGDTVTVEMQCLDKPVYTYWYSLMQQGSDNPGGGVTPADPPTNITPVSLGYFSAHTTQSLTIVVKP